MEFKPYKTKDGTNIFIKSTDKLKIGTDIYTKNERNEYQIIDKPAIIEFGISIDIIDGKIAAVKTT